MEGFFGGRRTVEGKRGDGEILERGGRFAYLYFNKFLNPIHDENMFISRRTHTYLSFITRAHPSTISICVREKRLVVRFFVIEIAENDGFGLDDQFTWLVKTRDFDTFWID